MRLLLNNVLPRPAKRECRVRLLYAVGVVMLISLGLAPEFCRAENAQEVLARMKKKYDTVRDAQLTFLRHETFVLAKTDSRVSGTLLIKKHNKYRVELSDRTIVTDGNTVWSYVLSSKQVLVNKYKLDGNALTPERVLAAAPNDYSATIIGDEKIGRTQTRLLKLVPIDEASLVETMKLWVDTATWLIKRVEIVDINGNRTVYLVNDMKINIGIPDSRFTFEIPKGVETVDLR